MNFGSEIKICCTEVGCKIPPPTHERAAEIVAAINNNSNGPICKFIHVRKTTDIDAKYILQFTSIYRM